MIFMVVVQPDLYIILNTHIFKQADILKSSGNPRLINIYSLFPDYIFSVKPYNSFRRLVNPGQKIKYRRLPAPRGQSLAIELAFFNHHIQAVHSPKPPKEIPRLRNFK